METFVFTRTWTYQIY